MQYKLRKKQKSWLSRKYQVKDSLSNNKIRLIFLICGRTEDALKRSSLHFHLPLQNIPHREMPPPPPVPPEIVHSTKIDN